MTKNRRKMTANSSGQLLIIAALMIAIMISSTTLYVYELSTETNKIDSYPISDIILALKQSTANAMVGSLANISKGGDKAILETNLNSLSEAFANLNQLGMCHQSFTLITDSKYNSGIYLSWNINGFGVSNAYANFTLEVHSMKANIAVDYPVNITAAVAINASYIRLEGDEKLVNLTCVVSNEEQPTLARNITLFYENLGIWMPVESSNNLSIIDYGNGTYLLSFIITTSSDFQVSTHIFDLRDIYVQANMTCTEA